MFDSMLANLKSFWLQRRRELDASFNRTLPFADYIVDRWEKARELGFGEGSSIYDSALVLGDVEVGNNTWIGPSVILDGSGGLEIGSFCSISSGVQLYSHDSVRWAISGGAAPYEYSRTIIGNNCYIGPNTIVAKGVSIGDGCIIGANSLVLRSVPAGSKAFGSPCRITGSAASYLGNINSGS